MGAHARCLGQQRISCSFCKRRKGSMRHAAKLLLGIGLCTLLWSSIALAAPAGTCSVTQAKQDLRLAERSLERAKQRVAEAKYVLDATRTFSSQYGASVGRWVRAARRADYTRGEMPILMRVTDRESGGDPTIPNQAGSAALGLLQIMPEWADGSKGWYWQPYGHPALWDRTSGVESLRHGVHMSWSNWGE